MIEDSDRDPIVPPEAPPTEQRKRVRVGRAFIIFLIGAAIAAFGLYVVIRLAAALNAG